MLKILANLLEYKVAEEIRAADEHIRDGIHALYKIVHEQFPDFEEAASNEGIKGTMPHQIKAQYGHMFAKHVIQLIDELYANHDNISLDEILNTLIEIKNLVYDNQFIGFAEDGSPDEEVSPSKSEFSHLVQFVGLLPGGNRQQRASMYQKIVKALHRVYSKCSSLIVEIKDLYEKDPSVLDEETNLVNIDENIGSSLGNEPTRAVATRKLMEKFVTIWGPQKFNMYPTLEDMSVVLRDPNYTSELTQFLNSLNRGYGGGEYKNYILDKLITTMGPQ